MRNAMNTALSILVALAGCRGVIDDARGEAEVPGGRVPDLTTCDGDCVGESPISAITAEEYANSVADVLGIAGADLGSLPPDGSLDGFSTNVASPREPNVAGPYELVAIGIATRFTGERIDECPDSTCIEAFVRSRGAALYRRPLTSEEVTAYTALYGGGGDHTVGLTLVVQALLQSPNFLYRVERAGFDASSPVLVGTLGPYELAARLAAFIWRSAPDEALLTAAAHGSIATEAGLSTEVERMLADPRADRAIAGFYRELLGGHGVLASGAIDPAIAADMDEELARFTIDLVRSDEPTVLHLFTEPAMPLTARLAEHYGATPPEFDWQNVVVSGRAGILGRGAVISGNSTAGFTRAVHRGLLIRERLLCQHVPAPNTMVQQQIEERLDSFIRDPSWSDREYLSGLTAEPPCVGCHAYINPLGFAFEDFDHFGRPVEGADASSVFDDAATANLEEMQELLARDGRTAECMASNWIGYGLRRPAVEEDVANYRNIATELETNGSLDLRALIARIPHTDAFRLRRFAAD
jgi:hypothetical protein